MENEGRIYVPLFSTKRYAIEYVAGRNDNATTVNYSLPGMIAKNMKISLRCSGEKYVISALVEYVYRYFAHFIGFRIRFFRVFSVL